MHPKTYNDLEFPCPIGHIIKDYIAEKRALGGKGNTESRRLREFSKTPYASSLHDELTEDAVNMWIAKRPNDTPAGIRQRYAIIRGLAKYMCRQGYNAYVPEQSCVRRVPRHTYVPYIFSYEEVIRFMTASETYGKSTFCYHKWAQCIIPLIFKMLYCTGMRVGEVLALEIGDIDFAAGVITVRDAKFGKKRYIPIHKELLGFLSDYVAARHPTHFLFPTRDGGMYSTHTIYCIFRETLYKAGIPFKGRGFGPRVHDFRHTFAVHSLLKWMRAGHDMSTALPRISTYLGHRGLQETEWYLRLTISIAPSLGKQINQMFNSVFPKEFQDDKR